MRPPRHNCVYRMYDEAGRLLYVGITTDFPQRLRNHAGTKDWWHTVQRVDVAHFDSRDDAAMAEVHAIVHEDPKFNKWHLWRAEAQRAARAAA